MFKFKLYLAKKIASPKSPALKSKHNRKTTLEWPGPSLIPRSPKANRRVTLSAMQSSIRDSFVPLSRVPESSQSHNSPQERKAHFYLDLAVTEGTQLTPNNTSPLRHQKSASLSAPGSRAHSRKQSASSSLSDSSSQLSSDSASSNIDRKDLEELPTLFNLFKTSLYDLSTKAVLKDSTHPLHFKNANVTRLLVRILRLSVRLEAKPFFGKTNQQSESISGCVKRLKALLMTKKTNLKELEDTYDRYGSKELIHFGLEIPEPFGFQHIIWAVFKDAAIHLVPDSKENPIFEQLSELAKGIIALKNGKRIVTDRSLNTLKSYFTSPSPQDPQYNVIQKLQYLVYMYKIQLQYLFHGEESEAAEDLAKILFLNNQTNIPISVDQRNVTFILLNHPELFDLEGSSTENPESILERYPNRFQQFLLIRKLLSTYLTLENSQLAPLGEAELNIEDWLFKLIQSENLGTITELARRNNWQSKDIAKVLEKHISSYLEHHQFHRLTSVKDEYPNLNYDLKYFLFLLSSFYSKCQTETFKNEVASKVIKTPNLEQSISNFRQVNERYLREAGYQYRDLVREYDLKNDGRLWSIDSPDPFDHTLVSDYNHVQRVDVFFRIGKKLFIDIEGIIHEALETKQLTGDLKSLRLEEIKLKYSENNYKLQAFYYDLNFILFVFKVNEHKKIFDISNTYLPYLVEGELKFYRLKALRSIYRLRFLCGNIRISSPAGSLGAALNALRLELPKGDPSIPTYSKLTRHISVLSESEQTRLPSLLRETLVDSQNKPGSKDHAWYNFHLSRIRDLNDRDSLCHYIANYLYFDSTLTTIYREHKKLNKLIDSLKKLSNTDLLESIGKLSKILKYDSFYLKNDLENTPDKFDKIRDIIDKHITHRFSFTHGDAQKEINPKTKTKFKPEIHNKVIRFIDYLDKRLLSTQTTENTL